MKSEPLPRVECVLHASAVLGESPVWCPVEKVLYWVDIMRPAIHCFNPATGSCRTWPMQEHVGSIGLRQNRGVVAALRSGFAFVDLDTGNISKLFSPGLGQPDIRFNDGRCDRRGRFWAGTLHEKRRPGAAALYRLDPNGSCHEMLGGVTVSNGIAWSPDDRTMYFADSWTHTIYSFDFDLSDGILGNRRVFAKLSASSGVPDGATVDSEGFLWSANFDGGCITRYAPDGRVARIIQMPVQRPTSCAFGGEDLSILYVTSASVDLTGQQRVVASLAGGLFAVDVGVKGLPEPRFAG